MPISESKKKANIKWDKENMMTLGCRLKKQDGIAFKDYAAQLGKTSNTLIKEFVMGCIAKGDVNERNESLNGFVNRAIDED